MREKKRDFLCIIHVTRIVEFGNLSGLNFHNICSTECSNCPPILNKVKEHLKRLELVHPDEQPWCDLALL